MSPKPQAGEDGAERIRKMVREYLDTMEEARDRSALARDYYDGKQWTREEIATLKQRGQATLPSAMTSVVRCAAVIGTTVGAVVVALLLHPTKMAPANTNTMRLFIRYSFLW